jgi:hypothetical protein
MTNWLELEVHVKHRQEALLREAAEQRLLRLARGTATSRTGVPAQVLAWTARQLARWGAPLRWAGAPPAPTASIAAHPPDASRLGAQVAGAPC